VPRRYSVGAVFEFTTMCSVAAACSPAMGIVASGLLMAAALALADRRGDLALAALFAALLAAEQGFEAAAASNAALRQSLVILVFAAIAGWFRLRRRISGACEKLDNDCSEPPR